MQFRANSQDTWHRYVVKLADSIPIGMGGEFYGRQDAIPNGWLICDGSAVSRTTYADLFDVIGTTYGAGDGSTTFNLPDFQGKGSVGVDTNDTDFNAVGKSAGSKSTSYTPAGTNTGGSVGNHTLTVAEIPSHNHNKIATEGSHMFPNWGNSSGWGAQALQMSGNAGDSTQNVGGGGSHDHPFTQPTFTGTQANINVVQPVIAIWKCIKAFNTSVLMGSVTNTTNNSTEDTYSCSYINNSKQDTLVSGTNIKTLNNISLIGSGNITVQERNYNIPIQSNLIFFGAHSFVKSEWRDVQKLYGISCDLSVTPGCTRWVGMRAWTTDNGSSGTGVVIGWFDNAGNYKDKQWNFGNTWGSSSDWGSYKISGNIFRMSDLPSGWVVFKSIIPDASAGTAGTIKALYVDFYDVPTGVTPSILGS